MLKGSASTNIEHKFLAKIIRPTMAMAAGFIPFDPSTLNEEEINEVFCNAYQFGDLKVAKHIIQSIPEKINFTHKRNAFWDFVKINHVDMAIYLLQHCKELHRHIAITGCNHASNHKNFEMLKCILQNVTFVTDDKIIALCATTKHGNLETLKFILKDCNDIKDSDVRAIFDIALENDHLDIMKYLAEKYSIASMHILILNTSIYRPKSDTET